MSIPEFNSFHEALEYLSPGDSLLSQNRAGSGGCINDTFLLNFKSGKQFFIKENRNSPANMFREEAIGLEALSLNFPLTVPAPHVLGKEGLKEFLILDYIVGSSPTKDFWSDFGKAMAIMHQKISSDYYGFKSDNFIGSTRQINTISHRWTDFFSEHRLMYQLNLPDRGIWLMLI